jgi:ketosteroid isomerase-like protein
MKRIAFAVCMVVLFFAVAILAQTSAQQTKEIAEHTEQELITLENEWAKSVVKLDLAFVERILADDYTWTDAVGNVHTKAEEIASIKSGQGVVTSSVNDKMKVRVYGDAAVVTGLTTQKGIEKGKEVSGQFRWTDTWVKLAGRWQCVADHVSNIAQK